MTKTGLFSDLHPLSPLKHTFRCFTCGKVVGNKNVGLNVATEQDPLMVGRHAADQTTRRLADSPTRLDTTHSRTENFAFPGGKSTSIYCRQSIAKEMPWMLSA